MLSSECFAVADHSWHVCKEGKLHARNGVQQRFNFGFIQKVNITTKQNTNYYLDEDPVLVKIVSDCMFAYRRCAVLQAVSQLRSAQMCSCGASVCRESGHLVVGLRADLLLVADRVSQFLAVSGEICDLWVCAPTGWCAVL